MKRLPKLSALTSFVLAFFFTSCTSNQTTQIATTDPVEANINGLIK